MSAALWRVPEAHSDAEDGLEAPMVENEGDEELEDTSLEQDSLKAGKNRLPFPTKLCHRCAWMCPLVLVLYIAIEFWWRMAGKDTSHDLDRFRPKQAVEAEQRRREAADRDGELLTANDLPRPVSYAFNVGTGAFFPYFNFVQGFKRPGFFQAIRWVFIGLFYGHDQWRPPVENETMGILSFQDYAKKYFGIEFKESFFNDFFTGERVPSWEDNTAHSRGVKLLDAAVAAGRALGQEPMDQFRELEPRFAFDNRGLVAASWDGFSYLGPLDVKYASNGVFGIAVVEGLMEKYNNTKDVLGLLMTDSVFSAHLRRSAATGEFSVDLESLARYAPIPGYAALGGRATFVEDGSRLRTVKLEYAGKTFTNFDVPEVERDFEERSKRSGWRFAQAAIIASLLAMTNLVMHVKDLHLELAAAFQAITVDAFAGEPKHPVRRLLDPFISRSVQATNDNFKLLFEYHAAEFSLAPLPHDEQLKLIADAVKEHPLNLADLDMERYGLLRAMEPNVSTGEAVISNKRWGWRWHYRALTVQRLFDELVACWLRAHAKDKSGDAEAFVANDKLLQAWWRAMLAHVPSLRRATESNPEWASRELTAASLRRVLRTLMVWLSWIHEDVGHSAAAYVYNPVYTPMCVPEDGVGVPLKSWNFNVAAYRGFVFLNRAKLLDDPPAFWFDGNSACEACFYDFQESLRQLGANDDAFLDCDEGSFYSCTDRVETGVSS
eukprot:TRINITY_DN16819_c0_g1_i1.p1 TRINITY_DN16819_c0_g1~~TRINITY_DN16819_c0_g1_i1.p1  ORF type:complete len:738 (-),score=156.08 TRINITY_DN16819_c0_g1_i1:201-2360(-)